MILFFKMWLDGFETMTSWHSINFVSKVLFTSCLCLPTDNTLLSPFITNNYKHIKFVSKTSSLQTKWFEMPYSILWDYLIHSTVQISPLFEKCLKVLLLMGYNLNSLVWHFKNFPGYRILSWKSFCLWILRTFSHWNLAHNNYTPNSKPTPFPYSPQHSFVWNLLLTLQKLSASAS